MVQDMSISSLQSKTYLVRSGDNLDLIARTNGYRDWQVIYKSKCNERLRVVRPNPNLIKAGDLVMLPPRAADIREALQTRLDRLRSLRTATDSLFAQMQRELDDEFKEVERAGTSVDVANDVLNIFKGLSKMCWKGYKTLEMGAEDLSKANKELAKDALDMPKEQLETIALKTFADQQDQPQTVQLMNSVWLFSAVVVRSWLDINSPSYWAGVLAELRQGSSVRVAITRRPADVLLGAKQRLAETRRKALEQIDLKVRDTERLLATFRGPISIPLPMK
jgi:hypothetical protein